MDQKHPHLVIATLVIGEDYRENLKECLDSKRDYAARHGYVYLQGDEKFWDRTRPIPWSKLTFFRQILETLPEGGYLWTSDADVYITNPALNFFEHVVPLLPPNKHILMTFDACGHINSGNMLYRNTPWTRAWLAHIDAMSADPRILNHIWWENGAMDKDIKMNPETQAHIEISLVAAKRFNAYCMGFVEKNHYVHVATQELSPFTPDLIKRLTELFAANPYPAATMWRPGDFLVHFAGIYDSEQMRGLIERIKKGETPRLDMFNSKNVLE